MIAVAAIDRDEAARARLVFVLSADPSVQSCAGFAALDEAAGALRPGTSWVLFLDLRPLVGIPRAITTSRLARIRERGPLAIVCTSTRAEDAALAYELEAVDFVAKPVAPGRVRQALARACATLRRDVRDAETERVANAPAEARPFVRRGRELVPVVPSAVDYIRSAQNYVRIVSGGETFVARSTLKALERTLAPDGFVRIHRTTLVNVAKIRSITHWTAGDHVVELLDGTRLVMSRTYSPSRWRAPASTSDVVPNDDAAPRLVVPPRTDRSLPGSARPAQEAPAMRAAHPTR